MLHNGRCYPGICLGRLNKVIKHLSGQLVSCQRDLQLGCPLYRTYHDVLLLLSCQANRQHSWWYSHEGARTDYTRQRTNTHTHTHTHIHTHAQLVCILCKYVRMDVRMYVRMYVCMYLCMYVYMNVCTQQGPKVSGLTIFLR